MRINHNITAMNSYRNFSANTSKVSKNLEKVSTGLRINRAGDDAAGLAISEKMRAQISGITGAEKNAKDGISLIQTAEGALTEVHDMLNRMTTLAEQSANGTYDDSLDRQQLQKEVDALKEEIDRIADSTNYNGIKLLDGSMSTKAGASSVKTQLSNAGSPTAVSATGGKTFSQTLELKNIGATTCKKGDEIELSFTWIDRDNKAHEISVKTTLQASGTGITASAVAKELLPELKANSTFGNDYPVSLSGAKFTFKNNAEHVTEDTSISKTTVKLKVNGTEVLNKASVADRVTQGKADTFTISLGSASMTQTNSFEVDGRKFQILTRGQKVTEGFSGIFVDQTTGTINRDSTKQIVTQLKDYGIDARVSTKTNTNIWIDKTNVIADKAKGGLTLQIGDTGDNYNTLRVSVGDMHAAAIGVGSVDISSQTGAQMALDKIKAAVNKVSDTRGSLGALQNRLDHTINNLGVMKENITSAESLIRDTDVAEEMMNYTKNNILNQSAQAMLAQANQLPQGVLQLLG